MKLCIINGDDFGASLGINRGIAKAHCEGVLTSASLMVDMPAATQAGRLARELPNLGIGLHALFTTEDGKPLFDWQDRARASQELGRQLQRFRTLVGRAPTHLDAHHNVFRHPALRPVFREHAMAEGLPLREGGSVRYFSSFYGQWDGQTHPEQLAPQTLVAMLQAHVGPGVTEIGCHPGYVDPDFESSYDAEREMELATLCDPRVREAFEALGIVRVHFGQLPPTLRGLNPQPTAL